jgi:hypothetical protein
MEGNEVQAAGNGRVHYGFVGGGKPSTGRRVGMLYTSITRCAARFAFRIPGNGETGRCGASGGEPCDLRWTRKEGTDVGWRLRADLHHEGDSGACDPGVACRDPVYLLFRNAAEESQVFRDGGRQGAQGGPVRARQCTPGEVLRSSRPSGRVRLSLCAGGRWSGATLCFSESRETPPLVGFVEGTGPAPRAPMKRPTRAVMEGGNSYPSCNDLARSVRDA